MVRITRTKSIAKRNRHRVTSRKTTTQPPTPSFTWDIESMLQVKTPITRGPKFISRAQVRKSARKASTHVGVRTIEMKKVISQRGRTHAMEAAHPGMPQTAQELMMESTAIKKFKYDIKEKRLRIWFVSGHVYDYANVPESVVLTLAQAQSKGNYFYYNIRTEYNYIRVR